MALHYVPLFPEDLFVGTAKEAAPFLREDCPYCMKIKRQRPKGWNVLYNTKSRDWIAAVPAVP